MQALYRGAGKNTGALGMSSSLALLAGGNLTDGVPLVAGVAGNDPRAGAAGSVDGRAGPVGLALRFFGSVSGDFVVEAAGAGNAGIAGSGTDDGAGATNVGAAAVAGAVNVGAVAGAGSGAGIVPAAGVLGAGVALETGTTPVAGAGAAAVGGGVGVAAAGVMIGADAGGAVVGAESAGTVVGAGIAATGAVIVGIVGT